MSRIPSFNFQTNVFLLMEEAFVTKATARDECTERLERNLKATVAGLLETQSITESSCVIGSF